MNTETISMTPDASVFGCMNKIQDALKNHDVYQSNYQYLMNSPAVTKLKRTNMRLKKQLNEYKEIIDTLRAKIDESLDAIASHRVGEDRRDAGSATEGRNLVQPSVVPRNVVEASLEKDCVKIKIEKNLSKVQSSVMIDMSSMDEDSDAGNAVETSTNQMPDDQSTEVDDDVVIIPVQPVPNIVYEIIDDMEEDSDADVRRTEALEDDAVNEVEASDEEEEEEELVEAFDRVKISEVVEEKVEEEAEEEAVVEEEEVEEEAVEEEEEAVEEVEEEVYEITIKDKKYYTSNETDSIIYSITDDGDIGDEAGVFKNGVAVINI